MSAVQLVTQEWEFPFQFRDYQVAWIDHLAEHSRLARYDEPGTGKTSAATCHALHKMLIGEVDQWIVLMPPIIVSQWAEWLAKVRNIRSKRSPTVTQYQGTPAKRRKMSLENDFILTSYGTFKQDFNLLYSHFGGKKVGIICDEAHALKNIQSQTWKMVKYFAEGRCLIPLTGTPTTKPDDAYAYIKLLAPEIYKNKHHFNQCHAAEVDGYGNTASWKNLELLSQNLSVQSSRILRREVQSQLPPVSYPLIPYNLDAAHQKLYDRVAEEQLVELENGGEINAINASALYNTLQQLILNWGAFAQDESLQPKALEVIDDVFDEIGPTKKLVIVAHYRRSNILLQEYCKKYGGVGIYGETSPADRKKALERFTTDPTCRAIILQPSAAGYGIDGLQHVCSDMLVLEAPSTAPRFQQVVARLDREGQTEMVNCRSAIARNTLQTYLFNMLLENDEIINIVQGGFQSLRQSVFGQR